MYMRQKRKINFHDYQNNSPQQTIYRTAAMISPIYIRSTCSTQCKYISPYCFLSATFFWLLLLDCFPLFLLANFSSTSSIQMTLFLLYIGQSGMHNCKSKQKLNSSAIYKSRMQFFLPLTKVLIQLPTHKMCR